MKYVSLHNHVNLCSDMVAQIYVAPLEFSATTIGSFFFCFVLFCFLGVMES